MKNFKVTYFNGRTNSYNSVIVKARSLEIARAEEEKSIEMFRRVNPALSLYSVEVA